MDIRLVVGRREADHDATQDYEVDFDSTNHPRFRTSSKEKNRTDQWREHYPSYPFGKKLSLRRCKSGSV